MSKDYTIQIKVNEKVYEKWKKFLTAQGTQLYGKITALNTVALEEGITKFISNPKEFKSKLKELNHDN